MCIRDSISLDLIVLLLDHLLRCKYLPQPRLFLLNMLSHHFDTPMSLGLTPEESKSTLALEEGVGAFLFEVVLGLDATAKYLLTQKARQPHRPTTGCMVAHKLVIRDRLPLK